MLRSEMTPPAWRISLAFMVAPMVGAFVLACMVPLGPPNAGLVTQVARSTPGYTVGGWLVAVVIGVPTLFFVQSVHGIRLTALRCAVAGALVAGVPFLALAVWVAAVVAAAGAAGGLGFWLVGVARPVRHE